MDTSTNSRLLMLQFNITVDHLGPMSVMCSNPHILSNNWTNVSVEITVQGMIYVKRFSMSSFTE